MAFLAALRFLTVLPVRTKEPSPDDLARAPLFFPVVGLLIGITLVLIDSLARVFLPISVASVLVLVALLAITGGLHIDGLADTCDGVFNNGTRERRLEIMRDSRTGSYGAAGIALVLLLQYVALSSIPPSERDKALILMATLSRWSMSYALKAFPYARLEGLGSAFRPGESSSMAVSALFVFLMSLLFDGLSGIPLFASVLLVTWGIARFFVLRLGGLTGDTYGAINEAVQAAVLVIFAA